MSELVASGDSQARFADELATLVSALRRQLVRRTAADWAAGQLSTAQVELLLAVERRPGISVRDVADHLNLAPNTVSTLVRQLTGRGLLVRGRDPVDRRAVMLTISREAERRFSEWRSARAHVLEEALGTLDDRDREALTAAMPGLRSLLDGLSGQSG
jgi:DNA-binding MarR family transcriptional regulator